MRKIGTWVTGAESLPAPGEVATLTYKDGQTQQVEVVDWDKTLVGVILSDASRSNFDTSAFVNLVHKPSQPEG